MLIEAISEANYKAMLRAIEQMEWTSKKNRIILFGAGTMGVQFLYLLKGKTDRPIFFCDNNEKKWGGILEDVEIIPPSDIGNQDIVVVTLERFESVYEQVKKHTDEENIMVLMNRDEKQCEERFCSSAMDSETLVLGDCELNKVCYADEEKRSIESILGEFGNIKVVGCNGIYIRQHYEMARLLIRMMPKLKRVFIAVDMRNFHNSYHLYPKNQHVGLFKNILGEESGDFISLLEEREKATGIFEENIGDRSLAVSEKDLIREQTLDMRAYYMYRLDEQNESVCYIRELREMAAENGIEFKLIMLPVNYERARRLSKGYFSDSVLRNMEILERNLPKGDLVMMHDIVPEREFLGDHTLGDGYIYEGRKRVAERMEMMTHESR